MKTRLPRDSYNPKKLETPDFTPVYFDQFTIIILLRM